LKRPSQYLRARGRAGRGHRPGAGRCARGHCKRRRGGPGGASAAAIRQAGGVIGPAIRPKAGRARRHRAGAARRRAVLAALGLAVCRRCSMARRSAVCWHRAGGRRWHGMQQAGRRGAGRCRWCAAGAGCCRRCNVSGPAKRAKEKGRGGGALCVGRPGLFCCCCRPGAGLFLLFAEGVRFFT
jgi:hypothetical protein